jgi:hypothetical protein
LLLWLSGKLEMSVTDEQNEILRDIWKQMSDMNRTFNAKLDGLEQRLTAKLDSKVDGLAKQMQDNFARVQRNFDRVGLRLDDIETRLTRVEEFCGLHPAHS